MSKLFCFLIISIYQWCYVFKVGYCIYRMIGKDWLLDKKCGSIKVYLFKINDLSKLLSCMRQAINFSLKCRWTKKSKIIIFHQFLLSIFSMKSDDDLPCHNLNSITSNFKEEKDFWSWFILFCDIKRCLKSRFPWSKFKKSSIT